MKKQLIVLSAAAIVAAAAVPALAFENEFHGMYKFFGYETNALSGGTGKSVQLYKDSHDGWFAENRARLQYIAKANDNLKLVTHFELDTRFGGQNTAASPTGVGGYKGSSNGNDSGQLDADSITLETKSIYLDFNCPITATNFKVGLQPWADAYQSLFVLADMTGVYATKKFSDPFTASLGWFRFADTTTDATYGPGELSGDMTVLDLKYALNKDMKFGFSYYYLDNDQAITMPSTTAAMSGTHFDNLHMVGLNADLTFGPANIKPFAAYQFGELTSDTDIKAWLAGAVAKIKAGPGAVNLAAIYLSGQKEDESDLKAFQPLSPGTTYFNPGNMWLLVRSGQQVNTSTSVLANDLTVGAHGFVGLFAGYEGTADKIFYNANVGYGQAAKAWGDEEKSLGTEINAQIGYKLFDNLTISAAAAYMFLGKGLNGDSTERLANAYGKQAVAGVAPLFGAEDADDPYMFNIQLAYSF